MQREILFRAWSPCLQVMYYQGDECEMRLVGGGVTVIDVSAQWFERGGYPSEEEVYTEVEDAILMQYTGTKDKNDMEIYEGDIVKLINKPEEGASSDHMQGIGVVSYDVNDSRYYCGDYRIFNWLGTESIEVIGNIYENPELLQGK